MPCSGVWWLIWPAGSSRTRRTRHTPRTLRCYADRLALQALHSPGHEKSDLLDPCPAARNGPARLTAFAGLTRAVLCRLPRSYPVRIRRVSGICPVRQVHCCQQYACDAGYSSACVHRAEELSSVRMTRQSVHSVPSISYCNSVYIQLTGASPNRAKLGTGQHRSGRWRPFGGCRGADVGTWLRALGTRLGVFRGL